MVIAMKRTTRKGRSPGNNWVIQEELEEIICGLGKGRPLAAGKERKTGTNVLFHLCKFTVLNV